MNPKRRRFLLLVPLALLMWAYQAASWRPKLVGVQPIPGEGPLAATSTAFSDQLSCSPDSRLLVSVAVRSNQYFLTMWSADSREILWQQAQTGEPHWPLAFSPDSRLLAVAEYKITFGRQDYGVYLVNAATGKQQRAILPTHYLGNLQSVAFLSDRELVVSTTRGVGIVDTQNGRIVGQWRLSLPVLTQGEPADNESHISADGTTVIALANGKSETAIAVYDAKTGKHREGWTYSGVFRAPRLSPDGKLWTMRRAESTRNDFYDVQTGRQLWGAFASGIYFPSWTWSAQDSRICSSQGDIVSILDSRTGVEAARVSGAPFVEALALAPDGDYLYTLDTSGKIYRRRVH